MELVRVLRVFLDGNCRAHGSVRNQELWETCSLAQGIGPPVGPQHSSIVKETGPVTDVYRGGLLTSRLLEGWDGSWEGAQLLIPSSKLASYYRSRVRKKHFGKLLGSRLEPVG